MKQAYIVWILAAALVISLGINLTGGTGSLEKKYPLLAKRLFVANPNDLLINFTSLREDSRAYINAQDEKIGFYFEYLPTGLSINIGANEEFFRASLIKLPGVMRAYKLIEEKKLKETDVIEVKPEDINPLFGAKDRLTAGSKKTVAELAKLALTESNNTAYQVLFTETNNRILGAHGNDEKNIRDVYDYLDVPRNAAGETQSISPKNYSSVLKSLYFSSYLSYESSSKILDLLTQNTFDDWLPQPIPDHIKVAHKFGVYDLDAPKMAQVHSDCGITYLEKRPYLLCIMVNSQDQAESAKHIQTLSKKAYDFLAGQ
jgi:beta-lactamase class A